MSIASDYFLNQLTDALIPLLRSPVEEVLFEVLDRKGVPDREAYRSLRERGDELDRSIRTLSKRYEKVVADARQLATSSSEEGSSVGDAVSELTRDLEQTHEMLESLRKSVADYEQAAQAAETVSAPEAEPVETSRPAADIPMRKAAKAQRCKVAQCRRPATTKGFCTIHYRAWRRGALPGY